MTLASERRRRERERELKGPDAHPTAAVGAGPTGRIEDEKATNARARGPEGRLFCQMPLSIVESDGDRVMGVWWCVLAHLLGT